MQIMNLGILAHVDAGKTTTVEQMLYLSGKLRSLGSVDKGSTQTDFLSIERQRGISVTSAAVDLEMEGVKIGIIDTPGHMDFTGEVERALSVLDGAVLVVSAAEGIQSQTKRFWKALRQMKLPTIIFLNKIDRVGCDPNAVLKALQKEFSPGIIPINQYQNAGTADVAVENCTLSEDSILELCENDSDLAERYLEHGVLSAAEAEAALIHQTRECLVFPLAYGAAGLGIGVADLMEAIRLYLPANPILSDGEPAGIVYKIEHDKTRGKVAHIRLYEGALRNRDVLNVYRRGAEPFQEKITQIRKVSGSRHEDVGLFCGNEIAAVCGMAGAKVGDMVGRMMERQNIRLSEPLYSVRLYGPEGKERELIQAISELSDEDPLMDYAWNPDVRELVIRIMGKIQLEILEYLLLERYGLGVTFSSPSVIYRETPASPGIGLEAYTMPKPCWAVVKLLVEPLARGGGYYYETAISDNILQQRYRNHIEIAIPEALKQGRLGWEVTDLKVTLIDGESHKFHTHPLDFFLATPIAVMKALDNAGSVLLEPLVKLQLQADEGLAGRIIGDILEMRGTFDTPVIAKGLVEMEAIVPVAASMDYHTQFSSLSSGNGIITSDFYGYKDCPLEIGATARRRGVDPLDRDKWILHKRGAL
ncbi:MAG: GTP-binding protein [Defluviitaleaceae bacterium]|nr:GTP-binding protein [Defluviitaleaceae bacterium]